MPCMDTEESILRNNAELARQMQALKLRIREQRQEKQRRWQQDTQIQLVVTAGIPSRIALVAVERSRTLATAAKRAIEIERLLERLDELK